jgi:hypothetical protein
MRSCALCETAITAENDSDEHLIPNALGGRRKVSGFLYRDCNSRTGEAWDAWRLNFFLFACCSMWRGSAASRQT